MTYERKDLISCVVDSIIHHKGELSYSDIGQALKGKDITSFQQAVRFIEMSVICHNIPFYKNNKRMIRELHECFQDAITFYNSNKAESEIVIRSGEGEWIDVLTRYQLPKLVFGDNTHYTFKSGSGKSQADLCDEVGVGYEVKRNYREGSRSSLHTDTAKYLIDCKNTTIEVRVISEYGTVDLEGYPLGRFNGFLSNKVTDPVTYIEEDLLQLIYTGELIPEIEKCLADQNFKWKP